MPFTKPKAHLFNIIIVGNKAKELTQRLHCYRCETEISKQNSPKKIHECWSYLYTRNGLNAKVKIWHIVGGLNLQTLMPNFFRRAHIVFIASSYETITQENNPRQTSPLKDWTRLLDNECSKATRIIVMHAEQRPNETQQRYLEGVASAHCCNGCFVLSSKEGMESIKLLLQHVHNHLFADESSLHNKLEAELQQIDLTTDKKTILNTTRCYERNGIA